MQRNFVNIYRIDFEVFLVFLTFDHNVLLTQTSESDYKIHDTHFEELGLLTIVGIEGAQSVLSYYS